MAAVAASPYDVSVDFGSRSLYHVGTKVVKVRIYLRDLEGAGNT